MALYRQDADGLLALRRTSAEGDRYAREIRDLAWRNLRVFSGEELFAVRSAAPTAGGVVDIVALTRQGEVTLVEVTGALGHDRLARCLELAGWARGTSLDELAGMYHGGAAAFRGDWQEFTSTDRPIRLQRNPVLVLIAQHVDAGSRAAVDFLTDNGVPVRVVSASVYEEADGARYLEVQGGAEPPAADDALAADRPMPDESSQTAPPGDAASREGRRVGLPDLIEAGLLEEGVEIVWPRPRLGQEYRARITAGGQIALPDGREFSTPSAAAMAAANMASYDGWHAWRVGSAQGPLLDDLRRQLAEATSSE